MTPPILQCLPSYWLPHYIIQRNSPSDLNSFAHHKLEAASSYTIGNILPIDKESYLSRLQSSSAML